MPRRVARYHGPHNQLNQHPTHSAHRITVEHAQRVWNTFIHEGNDAAKTLHRQLGFVKSSYYQIIENQGVWTVASPVPRARKWSLQQINQILTFVEQYPQSTLQEIIEEGVRLGYPHISITTMSSYLDMKLFTLKKAHILAQERNTPQTKRHRWAYATWFLQNQQFHYIYVDEFGFNLGTQRSRGRSRRGQPAYGVAPLQRGTNVSVILAIDSNGVLCYDQQDSGYTSDDFTAFIDQVLTEVSTQNIANACVIFDNCPSHKEDEFETEFEYHNNAEYNFLPPYSPFLNPIEECIGDIKGEIKHLLSTTMRPNVLAIAGMQWGQKTRARKTLLVQCLTNAVGILTPQMAQAHIQHSMSFLPGCLQYQNL